MPKDAVGSLAESYMVCCLLSVLTCPAEGIARDSLLLPLLPSHNSASTGHCGTVSPGLMLAHASRHLMERQLSRASSA